VRLAPGPYSQGHIESKNQEKEGVPIKANPAQTVWSAQEQEPRYWAAQGKESRQRFWKKKGER